MAKELSVRALVQSGDLAQEFRDFEGAIGKLTILVEEFSHESVAQHANNPTQFDCLILDLSRSELMSDQLAEVVQHLANIQPVIVTSSQASVADVRRILKAGALDFLPQPIQMADFVTAINSARSLIETQVSSTAPGRLGKVITFMKSCGGLGATTALLNCAYHLLTLSKQSERLQGSAFGMLDLDLQYGDVTVALDLDPNTTILEILEAPHRFDDAYLKSTLIHHSSGLDVLANPKSLVPLEAMTEDTAERILMSARKHFDYTFVDLPQAWTPWTKNVLTSSDLIVFVTQMSVSSVFRARRQLDLLADLDLEELPMLFVAAKVEGEGLDEQRKRNAEAALRHQVDFFIRNDTVAAGRARDLGVFIETVAKKSRIVRDIHKLSQEIVRRVSPELYPSFYPKKKGFALFGGQSKSGAN